MTTQIQLRRDTSANWSSANPVLAEGEIGMDMTVNAFKVGDGVSAWDDIDYAGTDISLDDYYTKVEADGAFQPKGDYLTDFVEEDPTVPSHVKDITQDDIDGWNAGGGSGGTGSSVHIGDTPPDNPEEGQQWLENTTGKVWIWDGSAWFQFPQGKDGAAGKDGNIADGAADGSQDGVFAVWDDTAQQWVPTSNIAMNVNGHISTPSGVNLNARGNLGALAGKVTVYANEQPDTDPTIEMTGQGNCVARISTNKGLVVDDYNGADLITINSTGEATFSGNATFKGNVDTWQLNTSQIRNVNGGFGIGANGDGQKRIVPVTNDGQAPGVIDFGSNTIRWKNGYFANQVITRSGVSIGTRDLIETLSTLRASTLDEAVDVRQALASACDKLIEKFTEMEKTATQEVEDDS